MWSVGDPGVNGTDGIDGMDGMKGENGMMGENGTTGEKGMMGPPGLTGAPGKNVSTPEHVICHGRPALPRKCDPRVISARLLIVLCTRIENSISMIK